MTYPAQDKVHYGFAYIEYNNTIYLSRTPMKINKYYEKKGFMGSGYGDRPGKGNY